MKAVEYWPEDVIGNNESGFSAVPAYSSSSIWTYFWTSSEQNSIVKTKIY